MTEWYYCETCQDVKQDGWDVQEVEGEWIESFRRPGWKMTCKKCGSEVEPHETYDCPIHGTNAPDGHGNCAKC